jgi:polysaccharide biosynthesis/export protein
MGTFPPIPPGRSLFVLFALQVVACVGPGTYVWIADLPPLAPRDKEYIIQDGDVLEIRVFNQDPLSTHARVRSDGRVAIPVLGDIEVRGKSPSVVKGELEPRLKDYVNAPSVTVTVQESHPVTVTVLGEVSRPGTYPVDPRATLAQVLALAGGLSDYATHDRLFVVRPGPDALRIRFTYENVLRGEPHTAAFALQQGDLVVAE